MKKSKICEYKLTEYVIAFAAVFASFMLSWLFKIKNNMSTMRSFMIISEMILLIYTVYLKKKDELDSKKILEIIMIAGMIIGIGNMLGFKTEENFNYPYISKSITEFWRRWHISLSTWFREYIYFPLGGSRLENQDKVIRNLFVVWLLTAVWHGSGWTFLIWGLWNFIFIFIEKLTDFEENSIPGWIKHIYLLWIVIMAWVPFRSADLQQTVSYIASMYNFFGGKILSSQALMLFREYWIYWMAGLILCTPFSRRVEKLVVSARNRVPAVISAVIYPAGLAVMFILAMSYLIRGSYTSFIYANF